jgi:phosphatidylserine/phosphatidylglycerophosphate/cardiolipin synthase-like enzyme
MSGSLDPVDWLDRVVGGGTERLVAARHHRRLAKLGQSGALHPTGTGLWAVEGSTEPRAGNALEVLIDGAEALLRMAEALSGAQSSVHIAGWHLEPDFALVRGEPPHTLLEILTELAERVDVRVLLWAGPPVPVFRPHRSSVQKIQKQLTTGTRIRCALDGRERRLHCHHEKLVIIDGHTAFVGGIDLTTLDGDRFDGNAHPPREHAGWHDVATMLNGPAVTDVAGHFRARWQEVAEEALPQPEVPAPAGGLDVHVVRTVPEHTYEFAPHGDFSILESYVRALSGAQRFIYLENQFLWSTEIVNILDEKLRNPPCDEFRIVLLLPAKPDNGKDTTRGQLGRLIESDDGGHRLLAATIRSGIGVDAQNCYVHAKVGIVDDRWLTVGSANLNAHSLFSDTEMNVVSCDPELARNTRLRLWSEHLELPMDQISGDPTAVIDEHWMPIAAAELTRHDAGEPAVHRLMRLPSVSRRSARLRGPMRGLFVDG